VLLTSLTLSTAIVSHSPSVASSGRSCLCRPGRSKRFAKTPEIFGLSTSMIVMTLCRGLWRPVCRSLGLDSDDFGLRHDAITQYTKCETDKTVQMKAAGWETAHLPRLTLE
jgi:hypothetical protein